MNWVNAIMYRKKKKKKKLPIQIKNLYTIVHPPHFSIFFLKNAIICSLSIVRGEGKEEKGGEKTILVQERKK